MNLARARTLCTAQCLIYCYWEIKSKRFQLKINLIKICWPVARFFFCILYFAFLLFLMLFDYNLNYYFACAQLIYYNIFIKRPLPLLLCLVIHFRAFLCNLIINKYAITNAQCWQKFHQWGLSNTFSYVGS